jgi:putative tricarboxylic transport membrane protein
MNIGADHVAGGAFVALGLLVFALSGDLPTGQLSMPGSGFMPKLIASLMIILGASLFLRARESRPIAALDWSDAKHAGAVAVIAAAGIALYTRLGFIVTMILMMVALLLVVERRNPLRAAIYSVGVAAVTYGVFVYMLKAPLPTGPLGF